MKAGYIGSYIGGIPVQGLDMLYLLNPSKLNSAGSSLLFGGSWGGNGACSGFTEW